MPLQQLIMISIWLSLEIGTVATDFEHKSFQTQIDECQRYLFVGTHGNEMSDNNNKGRYYGLRYSTSSSMHVWDIQL